MSTPQQIGSLLGKIATAAAGKRGIGALLAVWPTQFERWSTQCWPIAITYPLNKRIEATLTLEVDAAFILEIAHAEPQIIERANSWFGYAAIARLRLNRVDSLRPQPLPKPPPRKLTPTELASIDHDCAMITDDTLRDTLRRIGIALHQNRKPTSNPTQAAQEQTP